MAHSQATVRSEAPAIPVATVTLARSAEEQALLERALKCLADGRRVIAVADGGSTPTFVDAIRTLPGTTIVPPDGDPGLLAQVKGSLRAALDTGARAILYTEPDKEEFFSGALDRFLRAGASIDNAGIVVAARSARSFATFPDTQRYTEGVINTLCGEYTGVPGDYSYGPFLVDRRLVPHVLAIADDVGWGWRPFVFAVASRLGLRVELIEGDYLCPAGQRVDDAAERLHRIRQLEQNLKGLILSQAVKL
ncbi:MAG TPA: hypothetical protein VH417_03360 [Vicinamibacterales bacterium]